MKIDITKEYCWNPNWANPLVHKVNINKAIDELKSIEEAYGKITPDKILESSKNKKSVLHGYFDWDNEKAADKWRRQQATELLSRINVKIVVDGEPKEIRAFYIEKKVGDNSPYKSYNTEQVNIPFLKSMCFSDFNRIKNRISHLEEFSEVTAAIENVLLLLDKVGEVEVKNITDKISVAI